MSGLAGLFAGVCLACVDTEPDTGGRCDAGVIVHGDKIEFLLMNLEVEDVCPSGFAAAESHAKWMTAAWGVEPSPVDYLLFESRDHPCWTCRPNSIGCAPKGALLTTHLPDRHELSHASRGDICTSSLLEEGWATLYGNPFDNRLMTGTLREAMQGIEDDGRLSGTHYGLAAGFAAFVIETGGVDAVRELCTLRYKDATELDAALLEVLGLSLDAVQLELDEYAHKWGSGELRQEQACESADILVSPAAWTLELGCMAEGVEGKLGGAVWNQRLVDLPEGGSYTFEFNSPEDLDLTVELRSCDRDGPASTHYSVGRHYPTAGKPSVVLRDGLLPGTYMVRVMLDKSDVAGPELSVEMSVAQWP